MTNNLDNNANTITMGLDSYIAQKIIILANVLLTNANLRINSQWITNSTTELLGLAGLRISSQWIIISTSELLGIACLCPLTKMQSFKDMFSVVYQFHF